MEAVVNLELEEPGSATKVQEEGANTISSNEQYQELEAKLKELRAKPENKLGDGGFLIEFKDPASFENTMKIVQMTDATNEESATVLSFNTQDKGETSQASTTMAQALEQE